MAEMDKRRLRIFDPDKGGEITDPPNEDFANKLVKQAVEQASATQPSLTSFDLPASTDRANPDFQRYVSEIYQSSSGNESAIQPSRTDKKPEPTPSHEVVSVVMYGAIAGAGLAQTNALLFGDSLSLGHFGAMATCLGVAYAAYGLRRLWERKPTDRND
jgi:hypothetical protein